MNVAEKTTEVKEDKEKFVDEFIKKVVELTEVPQDSTPEE
jgi:hypothetical protein